MPLERCGQSPLTSASGKGRAVVSRVCRSYVLDVLVEVQLGKVAFGDA